MVRELFQMARQKKACIVFLTKLTRSAGLDRVTEIQTMKCNELCCKLSRSLTDLTPAERKSIDGDQSPGHFRPRLGSPRAN